jgi:hypothetical protein
LQAAAGHMETSDPLLVGKRGLKHTKSRGDTGAHLSKMVGPMEHSATWRHRSPPQQDGRS